ncbi:MAG: ABC transporter permease subunit [Peptoniphilus sp.]|nr:ABC transporter permease subunit [Peptoniphilus sp.]MDD7363313.1 ABC transporter permease subunit [Bacillota bacterium]MDY6045257.1 ABC transporter permease subunit [Peptoniphilus sp.]
MTSAVGGRLGAVSRPESNAKRIVALCLVLFGIFLAVPMLIILYTSLTGPEGVGLGNFVRAFRDLGLGTILKNSFATSLGSALITTTLAFIIAYTVEYTDAPGLFKRAIRIVAMLPMLLPTITYGFAIIYAFGKQGLITRLLGGRQLFNIYGVNGIVLGYIVYTLPVSFVLIENTMRYIDKKFLIISRVLSDRAPRSFFTTVFRPLLGTLAASIIQCFFLCFTDYGIPMAVGGRFEVIATALYGQMLGALPDFNGGSAIAVMMLIPSCLSILLLAYMERFNISYKQVSRVELTPNKVRDIVWSVLSILISLLVIGIFATIIVVPLVSGWPYDLSLTTKNFASVFGDSGLVRVYKNSIVVALMTALFGTILVYGVGLATVRSKLDTAAAKITRNIALISNTIPGMVLGIAYMLTFSGTPLQNTFVLIVICTVIHYYATPYLMMKSSLEKMDPSWETTARLMGDSWFDTVRRVITPNAIPTLLEIFRYYFVNAMVTVSAVIFIVGADTALLTTKIKELEHYQQFDDIFVLSLLILVSNLILRAITRGMMTRRAKKASAA